MRNLENSFLELLSSPSEMFRGIDIAQRLIWIVKQYSSSFGNFLVNLYISRDRANPFLQPIDFFRIFSYILEVIAHRP